MAGPTRGQQEAPAVFGGDAAELQGLYQTIAALTAELSDKASSSDLMALVGAMGEKVNSDIVAALIAVVEGKANAADMASVLTRMTAAEGALATAATVTALKAATDKIALIEGSLATVPQFVQSTTMTVEALLANFPASVDRRGKYARVSNYAGYVDRVLRCDFDANLNLYYWNPTQAEYGRTMSVTSDMLLKRLLSPTSIVLTGSILLGVTRTVSIETTNGRPGEIIEIKNGLSSLLGGLNIAGLGLGSAVSLPLGGYQKYMLDGASGSLQVVRLV